jgi:hypothetical protein
LDTGSIAGFVDQSTLTQPGHHISQARADTFDRMLSRLLVELLKPRAAIPRFFHPVARECA